MTAGNAAEPDAPPALAHATAPSGALGRGAALAILFHVVLLGCFFVVLRVHRLHVPADQPVIALVMEAPPAPAKPAPAPVPPVPTPPKPIVPAPPPPLPVPVTPKPALLALPAPPPPPAPVPPAPPRPVVPPRPVLVAAPSPPHPAVHTPALLNISTIPARPDNASDNPPPDYPESAREQFEQGQVLLSIRVAPDGQAISVLVTRRTGYKVLDDAARAAVLRWHFQPASRAGQPVDFTLPFWITFQLN